MCVNDNSLFRAIHTGLPLNTFILIYNIIYITILINAGIICTIVCNLFHGTIVNNYKYTLFMSITILY